MKRVATKIRGISTTTTNAEVILITPTHAKVLSMRNLSCFVCWVKIRCMILFSPKSLKNISKWHVMVSIDVAINDVCVK